MKQIRIEFSNGDVFLIPGDVIARMRTSYYASNDGFLEGSKEWDDEMKQSMRDDEISDWMSNNIDWSDIKDFAVKQEVEPYDYEMYWNSVDVEIIKTK